MSIPTTLQEAIDELIKLDIVPSQINSRWFYEREIYHPDDMSGIIIDSYERTLKGQPIDLESQIEDSHKHWRSIYGSSHKETSSRPVS